MWATPVGADVRRKLQSSQTLRLRRLASGAKGRWFESSRAHHTLKISSVVGLRQNPSDPFRPPQNPRGQTGMTFGLREPDTAALFLPFNLTRWPPCGTAENGKRLQQDLDARFWAGWAQPGSRMRRRTSPVGGV